MTTTITESHPTAAQLASYVVRSDDADDSVLEMIDKREQAPGLPVMVFLENEVRELADAHVYLDSANADSPRALDLLLGTQGWRRFAFVQPGEFSKGHGEAARRVLASVQPFITTAQPGSAGAIDESSFRRFGFPQEFAKDFLRKAIKKNVNEGQAAAAAPAPAAALAPP